MQLRICVLYSLPRMQVSIRWVSKMVIDAVRGRKDGKLHWKCIRQQQMSLLSIHVHFTAGYHCLRNTHSRIQLPEYLWFMQALSAHLLLTRVEVVTIVCARDSYVLPSDFFYKTVVRCLLILKNHTSRHARFF